MQVPINKTENMYEHVLFCYHGEHSRGAWLGCSSRSNLGKYFCRTDLCASSSLFFGTLSVVYLDLNGPFIITYPPMTHKETSYFPGVYIREVEPSTYHCRYADINCILSTVISSLIRFVLSFSFVCEVVLTDSRSNFR